MGFGTDEKFHTSERWIRFQNNPHVYEGEDSEELLSFVRTETPAAIMWLMQVFSQAILYIQEEAVYRLIDCLTRAASGAPVSRHEMALAKEDRAAVSIEKIERAVRLAVLVKQARDTYWINSEPVDRYIVGPICISITDLLKRAECETGVELVGASTGRRVEYPTAKADTAFLRQYDVICENMLMARNRIAGRHFAEGMKATKPTPQPESSRDAQLGNGPHAGYVIAFSGQTEVCTPRLWQVFKLMYNRDTCVIDDAYSEIWGSDEPSDKAIKTCVSRLNDFLLRFPGFPWKLRTVAGQIVKIPVTKNFGQ